LISIEDLEFDLKFEHSLFRTRSESRLDETLFDEKRFQDLILAASVKPVVTPVRNRQPLRPLTTTMAAIFSPLILPALLHDLPQEYNLRIKLYDVEGNISAQKHLDWFNDFIDLEEVDFADVKMRLFTQSLAGDVRKWFRALAPGSIADFAAFETLFLARWGDKKNPLQLLTHYNNMKRSPDETVQEFSARFMKVYNVIPDEVKPPPKAAQLRYVDSFESDFSLLLRERRSATLDDMMTDAIEVEVNLMASGKMKANSDRNMGKTQDKAQTSTSQTSEERFEAMMRNMERMMERMALGNRPNPREQADGPPRNPRRPAGPQIRQREQRNQGNQAAQADQTNQGNQGNQGEQQVRPPFQNNYMNEDYDGYFEDNVNCCDDKETEVFLTKEEHDQFMDASEIFLQDEEERISVEKKIMRPDCKMPSCNSKGNTISEIKRCLKILRKVISQRQTPPKMLRVMCPLLVSPKKTPREKIQLQRIPL
jgi:hypothetical protein